MTSSVSALSSFVARGRRAMHYVSSAPSKIPYGGFSPVRLQTESARRHLHAPAHARAFIGGRWTRRVAPVALAGMSAGRPPRPFGPEALGSPAGCVVPPDRRLLRPHPRLWPSPAGLCLRRRASRGPEIPRFALRIRRSVPSPVPRRSDGDDCSSSVRSGLRLSVTGSASAIHAKVGSRVVV